MWVELCGGGACMWVELCGGGACMWVELCGGGDIYIVCVYIGTKCNIRHCVCTLLVHGGQETAVVTIIDSRFACNELYIVTG